jgi:proteasome accessory factor C
MNITSRINRILFIMSYVSQNQGVSVEELAHKVGMRSKQLIKELEFISLIGKPPFKPDDYIDIYVENGNVYIEFDQKLNRPLRFTRAEAVALLMSLELLESEVDPERVDSLKQKIRQVISDSVDKSSSLQDLILLEQPSLLVSNRFTLIRESIDLRKKLKVEYYSLTRNETSSRTIRPYLLMKSFGNWYLTGYCEMRDDLRTFKFERILSVETTEEYFAPPEDFDIVRYKSEFLSSMGHRTVQIAFDPQIAPWIKEQWGESACDDDRGGVILTLHSETLEFPSRLVLGSAPHARPLSPPEFVEKTRKDAREILKQLDN